MPVRFLAIAAVVLSAGCSKSDSPPAAPQGEPQCSSDAECTSPPSTCHQSAGCQSGNCTYIVKVAGSACTSADPAYAGYCSGEACVYGCKISGIVREDGVPNPVNECQICDAAVTPTAWSDRPDHSTCTAGLCRSGTCRADICYIGEVEYAAGYSTGCATCAPATNRIAWTATANGTACGAFGRCNGGTCYQNSCLIGDYVYADGQVNPAASERCKECEASLNAWASRDGGMLCGTGSDAGCQCYAGVASEANCADGMNNDLDASGADCLDQDCLNKVCGGARSLPVAVTDDAQVYLFSPSTNYGTNGYMSVGEYDRYTSYLSFTLPSLGGRAVASATLYASGPWCASYLGAVSLYPVSGAWSESTITYDTGPGHSGAGIASTCAASLGGSWFAWDITGLVQAWNDGTATNHGVALSSANSSSYVNYTFVTTESTSSAPYVVITYMPRCAVDGQCK